jgi:hypothetical protein
MNSSSAGLVRNQFMEYLLTADAGPLHSAAASLPSRRSVRSQAEPGAYPCGLQIQPAAGGTKYIC